MTRTTTFVATVVLGAALGLTAGCGSPQPVRADPVRSAAPAAATATGPGPSVNCTMVGGPPSSVQVQVEAAVYPGAGSYTSEISTDDPTASVTATYATGADHAVQHVLRVGLNSDPVTVHVTLHDGAGATVFTASTTARPQLVQPNGPDCDAGTWVLYLTATPSGSLQHAALPAS